MNEKKTTYDELDDLLGLIQVPEETQHEPPVSEPVKPAEKPAPAAKPVEKIEPTVKPVQKIEPAVKPVEKIEPAAKPVKKIEPTAKPVKKIEPAVKPVEKIEPTFDQVEASDSGSKYREVSMDEFFQQAETPEPVPVYEEAPAHAEAAIRLPLLPIGAALLALMMLTCMTKSGGLYSLCASVLRLVFILIWAGGAYLKGKSEGRVSLLSVGLYALLGWLLGNALVLWLRVNHLVIGLIGSAIVTKLLLNKLRKMTQARAD